jgi:hypothetical protein
MENVNKEQKLNKTDEQLLISAVMSSAFFKEHLRKAWSSGRMFDMEQYKNRSVDADIKDVPDKALKFDEWFSRHYS